MSSRGSPSSQQMKEASFPASSVPRLSDSPMRSAEPTVAAVKAVHAVDECAARVIDAILANGGRAILTADHGNCELMAEADGTPFTAHTTSPVPLILIDPAYKGATLREGGKLSDVAPTMLKLMGLPQPSEMTGKSLI